MFRDSKIEDLLQKESPEDREYLRDRINQAECVDSGSTNHVYMTDESVIKLYPRSSFNTVLTAFMDLFTSGRSHQATESRIENVEAAKEPLEDAGFKLPEIFDSGNVFQEFEALDMPSMEEALQDADPDTAYEIARTYGENLRDLHDKTGQYAVLDVGTTNVFVDEVTKDCELWMVDTEFFNPQSTSKDQIRDVRKMSKYLRKLDRETYTYATIGFEDGYEPDMNFRNLKTLTTLPPLEPNIEYLQNTFYDIARKVQTR